MYRPIAKYRPRDLINHLNDREIPAYNLKLGLIKDKINIFDKQAVKKQIKKYIIKYNPYKKNFKNFYEQSEIYPITLHCIFRKKS